MASLTLSPSPCKVGDSVTVEGLDFAPSSQVTLTVMSPHGRGGTFSAQIGSDSSGEVASTDLPNYANGTLTLAGNAVADETVTIGAVTYTWKATVAATANQVLVGATASDSLDNLKAAINAASGSGTLYGSSTVVHPTVRAGKKTATTLLLIAKSGGTGGNSLASTETMTNGSFGGATFSGGATASGNYDFQFQPTVDGIWQVDATDGTNSASASLQVFTSA